MKNSKSIEKWLNDVDKLDNQSESVSYRQKIKLKKTNESALDLNIDLKTNLKLADQIKQLIGKESNIFFSKTAEIIGA